MREYLLQDSTNALFARARPLLHVRKHVSVLQKVTEFLPYKDALCLIQIAFKQGYNMQVMAEGWSAAMLMGS